jgi:hypothetical protein
MVPQFVQKDVLSGAVSDELLLAIDDRYKSHTVREV